MDKPDGWVLLCLTDAYFGTLMVLGWGDAYLEKAMMARRHIVLLAQSAPCRLKGFT